ncbi:hypothetical protein CA13_10270 [Planctomycetes bacterium CA13]|uniref:Hemerythrin-like domain-containing protein n=1 Tax=Novipirellula herctigrandis TaxID=2527986 RepID=A0A5C5YYV3_9BACT|nr:hypothetical protein CA13_10270 [Planctomycetes bacterium CA13]
MSSSWEQLERTCIEDHREIKRGYRELLSLIEKRDFVSAAVVANRLDKRAGPHIEFEEMYVFPEVHEAHGSAYVEEIFDERRRLIEVIDELKTLTPQSNPTQDQLEEWTLLLERGLERARSSGSLLVHLQVHSMEQQQEQLDVLRKLKEQGHRWSELASLKVAH